MKSYRKVIEANIPTRMAFLNITDQVQEALQASGIKEGLALVKSIDISQGQCNLLCQQGR